MKKNSTPTFDEFWRAYPLHRDRYRAEKTWNRLTVADKRAVMAALPAYIADCQQKGIQYKYAHGWLNGRRWEDEMTTEMELPGASSPKFQVSNTKERPEPEAKNQESETGSPKDTLFDMDTW